MFVTTIAGGMVMSTVPDICKTQVGPANVPIPYPNIGVPSMGNPTTRKVFVVGAPALTKSSKLQPTNGDQPGASGGGGVVSSKIMGPDEYILSSMKVKFEGNPAVRLTDMTKVNDGNTIGLGCAPSQTKVMVLS
jgi:small ligand-binding sensory domain FIST